VFPEPVILSISVTPERQGLTRRWRCYRKMVAEDPTFRVEKPIISIPVKPFWLQWANLPWTSSVDILAFRHLRCDLLDWSATGWNTIGSDHKVVDATAYSASKEAAGGSGHLRKIGSNILYAQRRDSRRPVHLTFQGPTVTALSVRQFAAKQHESAREGWVVSLNISSVLMKDCQCRDIRLLYTCVLRHTGKMDWVPSHLGEALAIHCM